ncbi:EamA family transporter [Acidiphilium sp. AL]|nr:EamA family transporter [Acidiphilium sp. AL]
MINTLALLAFTILLALGQLLFKKVGLELRGISLTDGILRILGRPAIYAAGLLYFIATVLWIWILSRVPLSRAYPYVAVGVGLVPFLSIFVFGEHVRPSFWVGVVLIMAGIIITQLGNSAG